MSTFVIRDRSGEVTGRCENLKSAGLLVRRTGPGSVATDAEGRIVEEHPTMSESDRRKHSRRDYREQQATPPEAQRKSEPPQETLVEVPVVPKVDPVTLADDSEDEETDEHESDPSEVVTDDQDETEEYGEEQQEETPAEDGPTAQAMVDQAVSEIFGEPAVEQLAAEPSRANVLAAAIEKAGGVPQLAAVIGVHNTTIYKARGGAGVSDLLLAQCERYLARKKPGPKPRKHQETTAPTAPAVSGGLEGQLLTLLQPLIDARAQQLAEEIAHKLVERAVAEHPDVRRARKILDAVKAVA